MDRATRPTTAALAACSPHTRGWTAPAGADGHHIRPVPRTRGDGPWIAGDLDPAPAPVPRTRGDGPWMPRDSHCSRGSCSPHTRGWTAVADRPIWQCHPCSPHTRGWTVSCCSLLAAAALFPAHAGMDRTGTGNVAVASNLFPAHAGMDRSGSGLADGVDGLFPAHAGMDQARPW